MQTLEAPAESELVLNRNKAVATCRAAHPNWTSEQVRNYARQTSPELFGLPPRGTKPANTAAHNRNRELADASIHSKRSLLVEDYMVKNRCSHETAWNAVRRSRPELFVAPKPAEQPAPIANRSAPPVANRGAIQDAVWAMQDENPGMPYTVAHNKVREKNPALFGL